MIYWSFIWTLLPHYLLSTLRHHYVLIKLCSPNCVEAADSTSYCLTINLLYCICIVIKIKPVLIVSWICESKMKTMSYIWPYLTQHCAIQQFQTRIFLYEEAMQFLKKCKDDFLKEQYQLIEFIHVHRPRQYGHREVSS